MLSHKTTRDANKRILIRIPCHNSSHQDAVASIGFNSTLIQELTVAPKLCYPEPCPLAIRITFHSLQMIFRAICLSNSRFFSLSVYLKIRPWAEICKQNFIRKPWTDATSSTDSPLRVSRNFINGNFSLNYY